MQLIDHLSITVRDLGRAKPFYRAVMTALGAVVAYEREDAIGFGERNRPRDDGIPTSASTPPRPRRPMRAATSVSAHSPRKW